MCRQHVFTLLGIIGICLAMARCSNSSNATLGLSCTATADLASGDLSVPNSAVVLSNVTVALSGTGNGPFTISLPGTSAVSTSTPTYVYSGDLTVPTSSAGVILGQVNVTDTSTSATASCALSTSGNAQSSLVSIAATPSTSAAVGQSITLTASTSESGVVNPAFTFAQSSPISGVTVTATSTSTAIVTSSVSATVTISVSMTAAGVSGETNTITLTFGSGSGIANGTTSGSVACYLVIAGGFYVRAPITFTLSATDGEPVLLTQLDPGETWSSPPPLPLYSPLTFYYEYPGQKMITVSGRTASGSLCNGGAPLSYSIYVNY